MTSYIVTRSRHNNTNFNGLSNDQFLYITTHHNTGAVHHYNDVIMGKIASQITSLTIVFSTVYSDADQRKHQSSASLAFVRGIHRRPVNSPHKWPVTRKMFPFDDVIMTLFKICYIPSGNVVEFGYKNNYRMAIVQLRVEMLIILLFYRIEQSSIELTYYF